MCVYRGVAERPDDLDSFCRALRPRLVGALVLYCGDVGVAEDLAQEALARAWEHRSRLRHVERPDSWVFRVAFNLAASRRRRARAEARGIRRSTGTGQPSWLPDVAWAVALRSAVAGLPPRQRAAIVARYYLDLDVASAALVLGCRDGTVKALTHQAIANLRRSGLEDLEEERADARPT